MLQTSSRRLARVAGLLGAAITAASLTACSQSGDVGVVVAATDTECTPDVSQVDSGVTTLRLDNKGGQVNELYVLRPDGSMVGERENIGPGTSGELTVELPAGEYALRCKPGMKGDGIRAPLKVSGGAATATQDPKIAAAVDAYRTWVNREVESSLDGATQLQAAIKAGDVEKAKSLYAASRFGWEAIEPVAEAFGDIDPKVDLREADLEAGQKWTGWHVIEKGLWQRGSVEGLVPVADQLLADLKVLVQKIPQAEITGTSMANGAKELLDEVASGKVTGEEEAFSHTDLSDFQANVDGAKKVVELLRPIVSVKDAALQSELDQRFAALAAALAKYKNGTAESAFVGYDTVPAAERQKLSEGVDALAEPLSKLTAAVVKE